MARSASSGQPIFQARRRCAGITMLTTSSESPLPSLWLTSARHCISTLVCLTAAVTAFSRRESGRYAHQQHDSRYHVPKPTTIYRRNFFKAGDNI